MVDFHIVIARGVPGAGLDAASALRYAALAGLRFVVLVMPSGGDNFFELEALAAQVRRLSLYANVEARTGVELRHVPPALLPTVTAEARKAGAEIVLAYGETLGDQVEIGTNMAAVEAGVDILTHPGLIDAETAAFAAERGVALEFTSSPKHALTNAHTAGMALRFGCPLVRGSGAACAAEMTPRSFWMQIIKGADVFGHQNGKSNLLKLLEKSEQALVRKCMTIKQR